MSKSSYNRVGGIIPSVGRPADAGTGVTEAGYKKEALIVAGVCNPGTPAIAIREDIEKDSDHPL